MTTYPAGTVAIATVRGVKDVRVMLDDGKLWNSAELVNGFRWHHDDDLTDVRPLVVLDFEDPAEAVRYLRAMPSGWLIADVADDIADQIEAQTKPPRMTEPGWGGKVTAHTKNDATRRTFLHYSESKGEFDWIDQKRQSYCWGHLIDPEPVQP